MSDAAAGVHLIALVSATDLDDLLPLMRAYCDFYETAPSDHELLELSRALIADPEREGVQLIARGPGSSAAGFATVFWSWDTTEAARIGIMNDLYVVPEARGSGLAERLVQGCLDCCEQQGVSRLDWETAPGNLRAQAVYDRIGAVRENWLSYTMRPHRRGE